MMRGVTMLFYGGPLHGKEQGHEDAPPIVVMQGATYRLRWLTAGIAVYDFELAA